MKRRNPKSRSIVVVESKYVGLEGNGKFAPITLDPPQYVMSLLGREHPRIQKTARIVCPYVRLVRIFTISSFLILLRACRKRKFWKYCGPQSPKMTFGTFPAGDESKSALSLASIFPFEERGDRVWTIPVWRVGPTKELGSGGVSSGKIS